MLVLEGPWGVVSGGLQTPHPAQPAGPRPGAGGRQGWLESEEPPGPLVILHPGGVGSRRDYRPARDLEASSTLVSACSTNSNVNRPIL